MTVSDGIRRSVEKDGFSEDEKREVSVGRYCEHTTGAGLSMLLVNLLCAYDVVLLLL